MIRLSKLLLYLLILAKSSFFAGAESPADFGFGAPEVVKLDWSTRSLTAADLDADGLQDLAVINNDAGKIELLYQLPQGESAREMKRSLNRSRWEPVLEDARFEKRGLTGGFPVLDMVVQDLNADGRVDLAYTSGANPCNMMLFDATGDGLSDLLYLSTDGKQVLAMREQVEGESLGPSVAMSWSGPPKLLCLWNLSERNHPPLGW